MERETHQPLNFGMKLVAHPMIGAPYRFLDRYLNGYALAAISSTRHLTRFLNQK
jgi:hypothetical protein